MDCSIPDSSAFHCLPEFAQIHVQLKYMYVYKCPIWTMPVLSWPTEISYTCVQWHKDLKKWHVMYDTLALGSFMKQYILEIIPKEYIEILFIVLGIQAISSVDMS